MLFDNSESIRTDGRLQQKALHAAIEHGQVDTVRYLLDRWVPGSVSEAEAIMKRSRHLRKTPDKKEAIRDLFREKLNGGATHVVP